MMDPIILPWPNRDLHPNARVHWARRAKAAKQARNDGYYGAIIAGARSARDEKGRVRAGIDFMNADGRIDLWIQFYPPDSRRRDDDGLISSFKPYRDGIAEALGVDDYFFVSHSRISPRVIRGGMVEVRIGPDAIKTRGQTNESAH